MACCGKSSAVRVERTPVAVANSPKIVRTTKHNFNARVTERIIPIKPSNDREKYRV